MSVCVCVVNHEDVSSIPRTHMDGRRELAHQSRLLTSTHAPLVKISK